MGERRRSLFWLAAAAGVTLFVTSASPAKATTIFSQNFDSSSTVSDYVSTTPNNSQFNAIGTSGAGTTVAINSGALVYTRSNANAGNFSRTTDFSPVPTLMSIQFDLNVNSTGAAATSAAIFQVGNLTTNNSADSNANTHSRIAFNILNSANGFVVRDINGGTNSASTYTGTQTVLWLINDSGSTQSYTAPDGSTDSLANDTFDVWVGTNRAFNDAAATTGTVPLTDFKWVITAGAATTFTFDNISVSDTLVPEPASLATLGLGTFGLLLRRRRQA